MRFRSFVLGGTIALASALPASAGNFNGWYIGLEGGGNWNSDNDATLATVPPFLAPANADLEFDTGWAALATMGYAFQNSGWRVEGEFGYRHNDIDAIGGTAANGELTSKTLMANVLYDFKLMDRLTLSVGAGAGAEHSTFDDGIIDQDEDYNFAYQGIAGLSYAVSPRLDLTMNYRYLRTDESRYQGAHLAHTDYYALDEGEKQTVTIGLRYDLYPDSTPMVEAPVVAPPAPPIEPTPAAPRQFLVFFGFDKSNLTIEAEKVIGDAAAAAKQYGSATVVVVGHADTSGSPEYNKRLSERRANTVRGALVAQGIDGGKITASGRGETELLVQTGDGVKEPQNRRATIDLN
jgi:outer membrane protein OmpA-like peptidoglycan-associated protein